MHSLFNSTTGYNNNYVIKIRLSDLTEVQKFQPSKETYIIWVVTDREITKNIGQISSSARLFSKKLKASFETVSSSRPVRVFITAEDDASTIRPGMKDLLTTNKFYK